MREVTSFRLILLRATYLAVAIGLFMHIWPRLLGDTSTWSFWRGVGSSLLGAVAVLAVVGIRYPLRMLPLLFFELTWKVIWLSTIALRLWSANTLDAESMQTVRECIPALVILPLVVPWKYALQKFVREPGGARSLAIEAASSAASQMRPGVIDGSPASQREREGLPSAVRQSSAAS
jgi:hypothetical protein